MFMYCVFIHYYLRRFNYVRQTDARKQLITVSCVRMCQAITLSLLSIYNLISRETLRVRENDVIFNSAKYRRKKKGTRKRTRTRFPAQREKFASCFTAPRADRDFYVSPA